VIRATQTGKAPAWNNLWLPDAIRARDRAFPHAYNRVKMPEFMKAWMLRRQDNDTCLVAGEVAFQAAAVMSGEAFCFMQVLEGRIQVLEKEHHVHKTDLDGG
jgi:hypothetical protein